MQRGGRPAPGGIGPNLGAGHQSVVLGGHATDGQPECARGQHEGPVGIGQGRAHGLHGPSIGGRGGGEVPTEGHLVLKRQVDDPVGVGGRFGQAVRVVDVAPLNSGADRHQSLHRFVGAGQTDHLVACVQQFGHHGRADPARCAGDKDSHDGYLQGTGDVSDCYQHISDVSDCQRLG